MRSNRAASTPIGQQNQPGHLKLSVLDEKAGKNAEFLIFIFPKKKIDRFFRCTLCNFVQYSREYHIA